MLGSFSFWCLQLTLIFKDSGQRGLGCIFSPLFHSFFLTTLKSSKFSIGYMQFISPLPTHSPQLEASVLILALNSIKISADLIPTSSIIYLFLLIFSLTLSFVFFRTKISTSHTYATQLFYSRTQICNVQEAFYMKRKVLCVCKGLSQYFFIDDFTLDRSCENDSRYC